MTKPDYIYDKDNWEMTVEFSDQDILTDDLDYFDILHCGTLIKGPDLFLVRVPITWDDDDGEPDDYEIQSFATREEAEIAQQRKKP